MLRDCFSDEPRVPGINVQATTLRFANAVERYFTLSACGLTDIADAHRSAAVHAAMDLEEASHVSYGQLDYWPERMSAENNLALARILHVMGWSVLAKPGQKPPQTMTEIDPKVNPLIRLIHQMCLNKGEFPLEQLIPAQSQITTLSGLPAGAIHNLNQRLFLLALQHHARKMSPAQFESGLNDLRFQPDLFYATQTLLSIEEHVIDSNQKTAGLVAMLQLVAQKNPFDIRNLWGSSTGGTPSFQTDERPDTVGFVDSSALEIPAKSELLKAFIEGTSKDPQTRLRVADFIWSTELRSSQSPDPAVLALSEHYALAAAVPQKPSWSKVEVAEDPVEFYTVITPNPIVRPPPPAKERTVKVTPPPELKRSLGNCEWFNFVTTSGKLRLKPTSVLGMI